MCVTTQITPSVRGDNAWKAEGKGRIPLPTCAVGVGITPHRLSHFLARITKKSVATGSDTPRAGGTYSGTTSTGTVTVTSGWRWTAT